MSDRIDYNQIDYPGAGMELLANAAREAINPVLKRSNEFEAKVITKVVDVSADFESDGYKKSINPNPKDTDKKYKFYAKVIGKQPQKFLAEGCEDDPSYSKEKRDQINTLNGIVMSMTTAMTIFEFGLLSHFHPPGAPSPVLPPFVSAKVNSNVLSLLKASMQKINLAAESINSLTSLGSNDILSSYHKVN